MPSQHLVPPETGLPPSPSANARLNPDSQPQQLILFAPLSGELVALECVPDPVFSQKMVGDGIAIDPLDNVLLAPCDGTVTQLHPAGHAVTLQTSGGVEILMHIGLDTVNLKGRGFSAKIKEGASVTAGTPLIEFDLDFIATNAKSALTVIVVTTLEKVSSITPASGMVRAGKEPILVLQTKEGGSEEKAATGEKSLPMQS